MALPVVANAEQIECTRLSARLTVSSCVGRYLLAQDRSTQRMGSSSGSGEAGLPYLSCRSCPEGKARAKNNGNSNRSKR